MIRRFKRWRIRRLELKVAMLDAKEQLLQEAMSMYQNSYYTDLYREAVLQRLEVNSKLQYLMRRM